MLIGNYHVYLYSNCMIRLFLILLFFSAFLFVQAQNDTLKPKKIYSISLTMQSGYSNKLNGMPQTFLQKMTNGTLLESLSPRIVNQPFDQRVVEFGVCLNWKLHKFKSNCLNYLDIGTGLSYYRGDGDWGSVSVQPQRASSARETITHVGQFNIFGVRWNNTLAINSRAFFKYFAIRAGLESGLIFARLGTTNNSFMSYYQTYPTSNLISDNTTLGNLISTGLPISLKYNASCELNLELYYKPEFLFFSSDIFYAKRYAFFQFVGLQIRYKLDTSPVQVTNKRIDMFF